MRILLLPFAFLFLYSCSKPAITQKEFPIGESWHKDSILTFSFEQKASVKAYDIFLTIKNNDDYKWSNLFLFCDIYFPNKTEHIRDTLEFILADNKGEWTGKGTLEYTSKFPFRKNVKFPQTGVYKISIQQAMRCSDNDNIINGISNVGFSIYEK